MKLAKALREVGRIRAKLMRGLNPFAMQETKQYAPLIPASAQARRERRVSKVRRILRAK